MPETETEMEKENRRKHRNHKTAVGLGFATVLILLSLGGVIRAHIVPPENLHPVVESYRRMTFLLNLNPVLWEKVQGDFEVIVRHYKTLNARAAEKTESEFKNILAGRGSAEMNSPRVRETARREVFELSTRTVARLVAFELKRSVDAAADRNLARQRLREARQIFAAFEKPLSYSDPDGFRRVGQAWLGMASALGSEGILRVGYVPMDRAAFKSEAESIIRYLDETYGTGFRAPLGRTLAPFPSTKTKASVSGHLGLLMGLPPGANINKQRRRPRQILNMAARGVDERETYLIALGDMAFDSSYIFGEPARSLGLSCNTCHNKGVTNPQFFIPGISGVPGTVDVSNSFFGPHANNGLYDPIDIPDLRGIRFTAPYGRNGPFASLRDFTRNVIVNEFSGPEPDPDVVDGLVAYMLEINFLPNPYLDSNGALTEKASEAARRGEKLFHKKFPGMQNRSCATCHVPATHFLDGRRHDIGTVPPAEAYGRDGGMDTPTLLGLRFNAPYFHDGRLPTITSVVDWFDKEFKLELNESEKNDLTAYLETVGDGVEPFEEDAGIVAPELEEFDIFMSTYETLLARKKPDVLGVLLRTVALEVRAHKWDLLDPAGEPVMEQMAQALDAAYVALQSNDMSGVDQGVQSYRQLYQEHREELQ